MDNDDELDKEMCKKFYETITSENADVVCCDTHVVDPLGDIKENTCYTNGIQKKDLVIIEGDDLILFRNNSLWNKIYKKNIIKDNEIKFEETTYADDLIFTSTYLIKSKKLIYLKDYFGYKWKIRTDSLSHAVKKKHIMGLIKAYRHLSIIFKEENKVNLGNTVLRRHTTFLLIQCTYLDEDKKATEEILKEVHDYEIENNIKKLPGLMNILNYFILNEHYTIARVFIKIIDRIRRFDILRKINRKI